MMRFGALAQFNCCLDILFNYTKASFCYPTLPAPASGLAV